jgi:hypothetical protein
VSDRATLLSPYREAATTSLCCVCWIDPAADCLPVRLADGTWVPGSLFAPGVGYTICDRGWLWPWLTLGMRSAWWCTAEGATEVRGAPSRFCGPVFEEIAAPWVQILRPINSETLQSLWTGCEYAQNLMTVLAGQARRHGDPAHRRLVTAACACLQGPDAPGFGAPHHPALDLTLRVRQWALGDALAPVRRAQNVVKHLINNGRTTMSDIPPDGRQDYWYLSAASSTAEMALNVPGALMEKAAIAAMKDTTMLVAARESGRPVPGLADPPLSGEEGPRLWAIAQRSLCRTIRAVVPRCPINEGLEGSAR